MRLAPCACSPLPQVNHWRSVVIFPRASLEPDDGIAYGLLLNSDHCQRVGCKRIVMRRFC